MGLFDKIFSVQNKVETTLSPTEAFAAIALAAIASDGYLSDDEARGISSSLSRMKLFRSYPYEVMNRMFDKLLGMIRREGVGALVDAAKQELPYELQETAFAVATDLVLIDGVLTEEEKNFLNDLYQALGVSSEVATQIVEVMLIKNRG
jgi:tellurite resistance protein